MIEKSFVLLPFVIDVRLPIQLHFPIKISLSRLVTFPVFIFNTKWKLESTNWLS